MSTSASKRTAFVTGASYGVGAATALALAQAGLTVAISATRAENLESILRSIEGTGAQALPIVLDLRSQSSIAETLKHIAARLGHLDLLVNNAAGNLRKPALDVTWEEWDELMAINLRGRSFCRNTLRANASPPVAPAQSSTSLRCTGSSARPSGPCMAHRRGGSSR